MGRGSWDDPRARATRGLRRMRGNRQTVLPARRAPTIKRWSLDARSEEQSAYSFWGNRGIREPSPRLMVRHGKSIADQSEVGRARRLHARWEHHTAPPTTEREESLMDAVGVIDQTP